MAQMEGDDTPLFVPSLSSQRNQCHSNYSRPDSEITEAVRNCCGGVRREGTTRRSIWIIGWKDRRVADQVLDHFRDLDIRIIG